MQFQIPIQLKSAAEKICYTDKIFLIGSCFTEHIGTALQELKFPVLQNPHGIVFNPQSVCENLENYCANTKHQMEELFQLNEVWYSWQHHSSFSHVDKHTCIHQINNAQSEAHQFLKKADWLIITLGSAFIYKLTPQAQLANNAIGDGVASCHRAPAQWFDKQLLPISEIINMLENCFLKLRQFNSNVKIIITISPVRHTRDGVVENNQSKARLIEAVHELIKTHSAIYYFPAYELIVDVLRDYRFYDKDLVHPNYMATEFVFEKFKEMFMEEDTIKRMEEIKKIVIARKHKPLHAHTKAHCDFLQSYEKQTRELMKRYPALNFTEELKYFTINPKTGSSLE